MKKTLEKFFVEAKPQVLRTDGGSEFNNAIVQKYLSNQDVEHVTTLNEVKANYAERAIKTIKMKISKYLYEKQTRRWVDVLSDITASYNATVHRSLKMSPDEARKMTDQELWVHLYLTSVKPKKIRRPKNKKVKPSFQEGDQVKLSFLRKPFERAYDQTFTNEIFIVTDVHHNQGVDTYSLKDFNNEPIKGKFYKQELQKVQVDENTVYKIEKIIRRRKDQVLVKWLGWPSSFNSWIPKAEVTSFEQNNS